MRDFKDAARKGVMWQTNEMPFGVKAGILKMPSGTQAHIVAGKNEEGWEHVSIMLCARRLPTWEEMCFVKDIFWEDEEEVVQLHPKKSQYVNMVDALHLWRPVNGDWSLMNHEAD
jgi:hypothetical protein